MNGRFSPHTVLLIAAVLAASMVGIVLSHALAPPFLGVTMVWDREASAARVTASLGPGAGLAEGTLVTHVAGGALAHRLTAEDFTYEPASTLPSIPAYAQFLTAQSELASVQASSSLTLTDARGLEHVVAPAPSRPLSSLPVEFWVQVVVGVFAWLIAAGVFAFRTHEQSARYLLLCGFSTLLFAPLAAVYSTRELALPGGTFRWLCDLNHFGGVLYCASMVALLWYYPKRLSAFPVGPVLVVVFLGWYAAQELGLMHSMVLARRTPVFVALPLTFILAGVQWRMTRADPVARAALSWFLFSWLVGTTAFAALTMVPQLFGVDMGYMQGYAFALFLLVYGGLAFGILRFRLFQLGEWWFRVFTWVLGAAMLICFDMLLFAGLSLPKTASLGVSLLVCGFLWLPLRALLWQKLVTPRALDPHDLFRRVVHVALAPSHEERGLRYTSLLERLFEPLRIELLDHAVSEVAIESDGLFLCVPAVAGQPALRLAYAGRGRKLYAPRDVNLLVQVVAMLRYADESREAYSQGVREERTRIARDLHDDIGSRLLSGLHQSGVEGTKEVISQALAEMRTIIHGLSGAELTLENVIAELRHETSLRLEAAGIALDWPLSDAPQNVQVGYAVYKNYLSMMRELVANVVRHARATRVTVRVRCHDGRLTSEVVDDGVGFDGKHDGEGQGIRNLERRLAERAGSLAYVREARGTRAIIEFPLALEESRPAFAAGGVS